MLECRGLLRTLPVMRPVSESLGSHNCSTATPFHERRTQKKFGGDVPRETSKACLR